MTAKTAKKTVKKLTKKVAKKTARMRKPSKLETLSPKASLMLTQIQIDRLSSEIDVALTRMGTLSTKIDRLSSEISLASIRLSTLSDKINGLSSGADRAEDRISVALESLSSGIDDIKDDTKDIWDVSKNLWEQSKEVDKISYRMLVGNPVEHIVAPQIRRVMSDWGGFKFEDMVMNKNVKAIVDGRETVVANIGILLYNDTEAMVVATKFDRLHICMDTIYKHIELLEKLRQYEEEAGIKGKKLFGAVLSDMFTSKGCEKDAGKNGFYIIEIREAENRVTITKPHIYRVW